MPAKHERIVMRLLPFLQRVNEQRYLYSIRNAFITMMPVMILGAFATAINQMPIPAYQNLMVSIFGEDWRMFGALVYNATMSVVTLLAVFTICLNLATWYNERRTRQVHEAIAGMLGVACYIIVSIPVDNPAELPFSITGVTGMFVAMFVAIGCTELFVRLSALGQESHVLSEDPSRAVPQSFAAVLPAAAAVAAFAILRIVLVACGIRQGLGAIVYNVLSMPYRQYSDSMTTAQLFNVSTHLMWTLGIHGNNVLDEVAKSVFAPALLANAEAVAAGLPPPHLVTKTLFDAFVYMGGSGTTLSLLLALLLFGKTRSYRTMLRYALPTAILNINEPIIFGVPIVLNPVFALPFILTPVVTLFTSTAAMKLGLVPYTINEVSWAAPVFFSGYVATGSVAGIALQAFNLALGTAIYWPFVYLSDRLLADRYDAAYKQLCKTVVEDYTAGGRKLIARNDELGTVARRLANDLQSAIERKELQLHYQPIVDAQSGRMHSIEALLRWKHAQHGMIHPMLTIALAEEIHRIDVIGLWVAEDAIRQRAQWFSEGLDTFYVSVNVSSMQLDDPLFAERLIALLVKHGLPAQYLQIELTETVALAENPATVNNLKKVSDYGVAIAMDDFGVGHSSLLYLRSQPIDALKIDGSLSRDICNHPANLEIISTIRDLCGLLSVKMVVEYVETKEQVDLLRSIGVTLMQGYYFSRPYPPELMNDFFSKLYSPEMCRENGWDSL